MRGASVGGYPISQPYSSVRIQAGFSTTIQCYVEAEGHFSFFWIQVPLEGVSVFIANVNSLRGNVQIFGQFKNNSRIRVVLKKRNFSLTFLSLEPSDTATYICGGHGYDQLYFGNGTKLFVEDVVATKPTTTSKDEDESHETPSVFNYAVPVLSATNMASICVIIALIYHLFKKNKSGAARPERGTGECNTDDVSYAALTFRQNLKYTVRRGTSMDTTVIYGDVQHHEGK
ncbi:uncharacterized protein LOC124386893 isoform X2 [Silurus meridionalis]|uniref:uncharacterized protein LOC124386893 isoform X2 n=1 Tax=Silurus meridionalis TaxID=175797 RepID=UPI001EEA4835|nr:uncharacterized protein LOC124386893 isoform X2 [Silurus meridionalis]